MTRKQIYAFTAITTVLSLIGTWSLVQAQQAAPGAAPAKTPARPGSSQSWYGSGGSSGMMPGNMGGMGMQNMMGSMTTGAAAPENDPEMAEFAEAEATLAAEADELLSQYASADAKEEQKQLKDQLRDTLAKQFDVQRQRRELELQRIDERVQKLREQIKKRNDARQTIIDRRFEQLISEADGLGWGQPTAPMAGRRGGMLGGMPGGMKAGRGGTKSVEKK